MSWRDTQHTTNFYTAMVYQITLNWDCVWVCAQSPFPICNTQETVLVRSIARSTLSSTPPLSPIHAPFSNPISLSVSMCFSLITRCVDLRHLIKQKNYPMSNIFSSQLKYEIHIYELSCFTVWIRKKKWPLDEQNFNKSAWIRREIKEKWNKNQKKKLKLRSNGKNLQNVYFKCVYTSHLELVFHEYCYVQVLCWATIIELSN